MDVVEPGGDCYILNVNCFHPSHHLDSIYPDIILMRIILADHNTQSLWALTTALQEQVDLEVVGVVDDAHKLIEISRTQSVEVVLFDAKLPGADIEELISILHGLIPKPFVMVMSSDFETSRMLLKAGADAFISKGDQPDWLIDKLLTVKKRCNLFEES